MGKNLVEKILAGHLVSGKLVPGEEIGIHVAADKIAVSANETN